MNSTYLLTMWRTQGMTRMLGMVLAASVVLGVRATSSMSRELTDIKSSSDVSQPFHAMVKTRRQQQNATSWPYGPLRTRGRDIVNTRGDVITFAGVNWPLNEETMIPEGIEHAAADDILAHVASVGFNFIRMWVRNAVPSGASGGEILTGKADLAANVGRTLSRWSTKSTPAMAAMSHSRPL